MNQREIIYYCRRRQRRRKWWCDLCKYAEIDFLFFSFLLCSYLVWIFLFSSFFSMFLVCFLFSWVLFMGLKRSRARILIIQFFDHELHVNYIQEKKTTKRKSRTHAHILNHINNVFKTRKYVDTATERVNEMEQSDRRVNRKA